MTTLTTSAEDIAAKSNRHRIIQQDLHILKCVESVGHTVKLSGSSAGGRESVEVPEFARVSFIDCLRAALEKEQAEIQEWLQERGVQP